MYPDKDTIQEIRLSYPEGCRVSLIKMEDLHAPPIGTTGTVQKVDDIGSIFVKWDNGSRLAIIYGEDVCVKI